MAENYKMTNILNPKHSLKTRDNVRHVRNCWWDEWMFAADPLIQRSLSPADRWSDAQVRAHLFIVLQNCLKLHIYLYSYLIAF